MCYATVSANGDAKKSKLADTMAKHMQSLLDDPDRAREMGLTGRTRVLNEFSFASFQEALHQHVTRLHGAVRLCSSLCSCSCGR